MNRFLTETVLAQRKNYRNEVVSKRGIQLLERGLVHIVFHPLIMVSFVFADFDLRVHQK